MRSLSRIECTAVGCTNEASVQINDDMLCAHCAHADLPVTNPQDLFGLPVLYAEFDEPVEEIKAALAAGKCGECYPCGAGYHEQCIGKWADMGLFHCAECPYCKAEVDPETGKCSALGCGCGWCPAHLTVLGEGGHCPECERLGQRELDLCKRVHPRTNDIFVRYYLQHKFSNHRAYKLPYIIWNTWGLGKDQALLDCITMGYALCVAKPLIDQIHDRMETAYMAWERSVA